MRYETIYLQTGRQLSVGEFDLEIFSAVEIWRASCPATFALHLPARAVPQLLNANGPDQQPQT